MNLLEKFKDKQLDAQSMKQITGGAMYECKCAAHAGTWTGNYQNANGYGTAIANYCTGGGSCKLLDQQEA